MPNPLLGLTGDPIGPQDVVRLLEAENDVGRHGAVAVFLGIVRGDNLGRQVLELYYEAYEPLAMTVLEQIAGEVAERWPGVRLALRHRLGRVAVGQTSVAIAASSPHRAEAFEACRYAIERLKQVVPIWKREIFQGGEEWIEGAAVDPADAAAREAAYRRACG
jgi:molybdopterin synthase catalytic subunit